MFLGKALDLWPELIPVSGSVVKTFREISYLWSLSFEIIALSGPVADIRNILHISNGQNNGSPGNRLPAVFFHQYSHNLLIRSYVNGDANFGFTSASPVSQKDWTKVTIEQVQDAKTPKKYRYRIHINGSLVLDEENSTPREFENMKFYVSDPWYKAPEVKIRNLVHQRYQCKMLHASIPVVTYNFE